jgi:hypothetical protein
MLGGVQEKIVDVACVCFSSKFLSMFAFFIYRA